LTFFSFAFFFSFFFLFSACALLYWNELNPEECLQQASLGVALDQQ